MTRAILADHVDLQVLDTRFVASFRTARETTVHASRDRPLLVITVKATARGPARVELRRLRLVSASGDWVFPTEVTYTSGMDFFSFLGMRQPDKLTLAAGEVMSRNVMFLLPAAFEPAAVIAQTQEGEVRIPLELVRREPVFTEPSVPEDISRATKEPPVTARSIPIDPLSIGPDYIFSIRLAYTSMSPIASLLARQSAFGTYIPAAPPVHGAGFSLGFVNTRYRVAGDLDWARGHRSEQPLAMSAGGAGFFKAANDLDRQAFSLSWFQLGSTVHVGPQVSLQHFSNWMNLEHLNSDEVRVTHGRSNGTGGGLGVTAALKMGAWSLRLAPSAFQLQSGFFYRQIWWRRQTGGLLLLNGTSDIPALNLNSEKLNALAQKGIRADLSSEYMFSDFIGISMRASYAQSTLHVRNYSPRSISLVRTGRIEDSMAVYWAERTLLNRRFHTRDLYLSAGIAFTEAWTARRSN